MPVHPRHQRGAARIAGRFALLLLLIQFGAAAAAPSPDSAGTARQANADLQAVASNGTVLVAVGGAATVLISRDSGRNWSHAAIDHSASLIDVAACPDKTFAALDFYRGIWLGDAQGQNWRRVALPGDTTPMALACAPAGGLWVVGSYTTVLSSKDQGKSWQKSDFGEDAILTSIQFIDAQTAMIEGEFGIILRSEDGGGSWKPLARVPGDFYPFDGAFKSRDEGWLTGRGGKILHTSDGGLSWSEEAPPIPGVPMYRFGAADSGRLFAVGELGLIAERVEGRWQLVGGRALGGYLRGALVLTAASSLVVVGGSGAATPQAVDLARAP